MDVAVFGGTGFIGKNYIKYSSNQCQAVNREDLISPHAQILYLTGTTDNYNIFTDPTLDVRTNIELLINVLEANRKNNPDFVFNFVSSWFVYGEAPIPFKVEAHCSPKGFYSISKYSAEMFLLSFCKTYKINYRILRLGNVYGPGDRGVSKKKNALQYLIENLRVDKTVDLYEGGNVIRDYIHVRDLVSAIDLILTKSELNKIINVSTGIPTKLADVIELAKVKLESASVIKSISAPEFHRTVQVKDSLLDVSYLKSLGFIPKYVLEHEILNL